MNSRKIVRALSIGQGAYFLGTGIWPIINRSAFERVTGPKADFWLVRTVGLLVGLIGGILIWSGLQRREPRTEVAMLAVGSATALATVDTVYAMRKRISQIYLADALIQAALVIAWAWARR